MNTNVTVDPIQRELPPEEILFWARTYRYGAPNSSSYQSYFCPSGGSQGQKRYIRKAKKVDSYHLACLKKSIGTTGLLWNPANPIAVIKLHDGRYVAMDGNLRLLAIRELLQDRAWCRAYAEYAARLRKGIMVLDFGAWSDDADRMAIGNHVIRNA